MGDDKPMNDRLHENDDSIEPSAPPAVPELSQLMVQLLKGVLYRDDDERLWAGLLRLQARVREQAAVLLLDLMLDEAEGYAFLKSRPDADEPEGAPRLPRLVLARDEIVEMMRVFLPEGSNEARLVDQVDATVARVVELGFMRRLKPAAGSAQDRGHYEVRRILKAFVDAQWLADFDARLATYRTALSGAAPDPEAADG